MQSSNEPRIATDQKEIVRLLSKGRDAGRRDVFPGKRRWARFQLGLPLQIMIGRGQSAETLSAVMHNISGGGIGFWSRRALSVRDQILLREETGSGRADWTPIQVTHCAVGIKGFLIGARFESPCEPDPEFTEESSVSQEEDADTPEPGAPATRTNLSSLKTKTGFISAAAACGGAAVMYVCSDMTAQGVWPTWIPVVSLLGVCIAFGLAGTLIVRGETRFVKTFRTAIHDMATRGDDVSQIAQAPTKELIELRRAFLDLGSHWQRREDDERAQRQKLEELAQLKSNILSIVSHDLRTPLTSILLYAQMLSEEIDSLSDEDRDHFLSIITEECNRLSRLVDDLLEVQRLESDRGRWDMRAQDLSGTIRNCARVFEAIAASKSIDLTVDCPDSLPATEADADKISQVISNLLSNAIKYTPCGGGVHLGVEARTHEIVLRVADTGPGIPRDKWDQIFDRFSQLGDPNVSDIKGFGLGLYIVKRIVQEHGGAAWVDSEVGRGSEFCVSLPTEAGAARTTKDASSEPGTVGRVLVCDPDPELASVIERTLRLHGFTVRTCHSGCRLLAQLAQGDIDVVVTDVLLPDMDAADILDALGPAGQRSYTVIAHTYADDEEELRNTGVDVVLRRPVSAEELVKTVADAMNLGEEINV